MALERHFFIYIETRAAIVQNPLDFGPGATFLLRSLYSFLEPHFWINRLFGRNLMPIKTQQKPAAPSAKNQNRRRWITPAVTLFFLAPAIGELLSGSAPPAEFFNPVGLLLLASLYGGGALIVRELSFRWGKGWPTILILGAAYGIAEEGLMVKSFFDPNWMDLGTLGTYGRWAGVNWVWSLELTIYHAVISIAIPILLVNLLFPVERETTWLSARGFTWISGFFLLDITLGYLVLTPYRPPTVLYLLTILCVYLLYRNARRAPHHFPTIDRPPAKPRAFAIAGLVWIVSFFISIGMLSNTAVPALITMVFLVLITWSYGRMLLRLRGSEMSLSPRHQWALAVGPLAFFVILAPLQEIDATRLDNTSGMFWVGVATLVFLIWLARRLKIDESPRIIYKNLHDPSKRLQNVQR